MLRFFKDFMIYGVASVVGRIAGILLLPVYTSILTREEYGAMAMLMSLYGVIDLVSNFNIHSGIARDYYEKGVDRKRLVSTGFWSILALSCSIMAIMMVTRKFWVGHVLGLSDNFVICFVFLLLSVPTGSLSSYFSILTRFKKRPVLFSTGVLIQTFLQIGTAILTIVVFKIGVLGFFIAHVVANLFGIIYFALINREFLGFRFEKEYLRKALMFSIPTLPAILAGWLDSSMGQILMGKYVSLTDLGVYSIALQFASVFTLISVALNNVWSPYLYENYKKVGFVSEVRRIFLIMVFFISVVASCISLLSREVILIFSNPNYLEAGKYFTLLCVPMGFYLLFPFASSGVSVSRDTKFIGISYVAGSVFNLAFLFALLPVMGVYCVPVGLALSRILSYSILYYVTNQKGLLTLPNGVLVMYVGVVLVCFLVVLLDLSIWWRLLVMVILNGGLFVLFDRKVHMVEFIKDKLCASR